jgi:hypothetical protein
MVQPAGVHLDSGGSAAEPVEVVLRSDSPEAGIGKAMSVD